MIIGAIEVADAEHVAGWLYSPATDLEGNLVLAFLDGACVGTGRIGLHRPDLEAAGLGHGRYGWHFPVTLDAGAEPGRIVVSLDRCEAMILQRGATVRMDAAARAPLGAVPPAPALLEWLEERGALSAAEREFLTTLHAFGVATWPLSPGDAPDGAAAALLSLLCGGRVGCGRLALDGDAPAALAAALETSDGPLARAGVLLFHAEEPATVTVVEGAHGAGDGLLPGALDHGIRYAVDPEALLAVLRAGRFRLEPVRTPVLVFHPTDPA